jgi:hypothetical protein
LALGWIVDMNSPHFGIVVARGTRNLLSCHSGKAIRYARDHKLKTDTMTAQADIRKTPPELSPMAFVRQVHPSYAALLSTLAAGGSG